MKEHPIKSSSFFYETELASHKAEFNTLQQQFKDNDARAIRESGEHKSEIEAKIEKCKSTQGPSPSCPEWATWQSWLSCTSQATCNQSHTMRYRKCRQNVRIGLLRFTF